MNRGNRITPFLLLLFALAGCLPARSHSAAINHESPLIGTWRLLEYLAWDSAGKPQQVFGPTPSGYVSFEVGGIAFIQIMNPDDPASFAAYYGSFSVNAAADSLSILVEGTNLPSYLRTVQKRPFRIRGDTLTLGYTGQYRATLVKVAGR
jgi:hypothetical protein